MALILFLLELLLPVTITAGLLYWLSGILPLWNLNRTLALAILAVVLVLFSLIFSVVLDGLTLPFRRRGKGEKPPGFFNRVDPRFRLTKFILGGLVIPIAVFVAALQVRFPGPQPAVSLLLQPRATISKAPHAVLIGDALLQSANPATQIQGIKTLQTLPAADAQPQLLRLVQDDPSALGDAAVSQALTKALASYGLSVKPQLLAIFTQVDPARRKAVTGSDSDLYQRYFSAPFEGLKKELASQNPTADPSGIDTVASDLQVQLNKLQTGQTQAGGDPRLRFVLDTFLAMDIQQDPDLLAFAKKVAADATYSDGLRGQALLLVGKLGGNNELDGLYAALQGSSELLQAKALEAIATLQAKGTVSSKK